jgi:hypothetical protein
MHPTITTLGMVIKHVPASHGLSALGAAHLGTAGQHAFEVALPLGLILLAVGAVQAARKSRRSN